MKMILLSLSILSTSAFAQWIPNPIPFPECTRAEVRATLPAVEAVCSAKVEAFASEKGVNCDLTTVEIYGCKASCADADGLFAKLRLDVNTNCRSQTATLRKTVIKYY